MYWWWSRPTLARLGPEPAAAISAISDRCVICPAQGTAANPVTSACNWSNGNQFGRHLKGSRLQQGFALLAGAVAAIMFANAVLGILR